MKLPGVLAPEFIGKAAGELSILCHTKRDVRAPAGPAPRGTPRRRARKSRSARGSSLSRPWSRHCLNKNQAVFKLGECPIFPEQSPCQGDATEVYRISAGFRGDGVRWSLLWQFVCQAR